MKPTKETIFLPISELEKYNDSQKYYCMAIVFSPETENEHFDGCPPYIAIGHVDFKENDLYFKVPEIVAYYGKIHAGYTMKGLKDTEKKGEEILAKKIKCLLNI